MKFLNSYLFFLIVLFLFSCTSKKEILYLQDIENVAVGSINYDSPLIQPNDILKITVDSGIASIEALMPYNRDNIQTGSNQSIELIQLNGYLVDIDQTINFPVLGRLSTLNQTLISLSEKIEHMLEIGGHLDNPIVNVRLLNAKVTILGEVNNPGTYMFTEQNLSFMQALGYAGDMTINGIRNDVLISREVNGIRKVSHIDLNSSSFMNSQYYFIKPNDLIIVNPNNPKIKSAGFVGSVGTVATVLSIAISLTILITR